MALPSISAITVPAGRMPGKAHWQPSARGGMFKRMLHDKVSGRDDRGQKRLVRQVWGVVTWRNGLT